MDAHKKKSDAHPFFFCAHPIFFCAHTIFLDAHPFLKGCASNFWGVRIRFFWMHIYLGTSALSSQPRSGIAVRLRVNLARSAGISI
jgi:hypothetical protein